jgi:serine/threonine protein kinase
MAAQPPDSLIPPPALGRFKVIKLLGEGAQAAVWLAYDPRLDREVAVKVLRPGTDAVSVDTWLHEARAVSRLTHPNIVPVFEADVQDGQAYMVFEYVAGGTLGDRLRAQPGLSVRDAVELMVGVLGGLQAAHEAEVVHRDLKPSNILFDASGRPRVMDFGIAARLSDAARPQRIIGTPGYISPEAASGAAPSPLMDVFAAAVLLAEMLSGQRMNADSDPWRAVRRMAEQDMALPAGLPPEVDDALRALVQRGLARDGRRRWPSARAMQQALNDWLHPPFDALAAAENPADSATLEFLLRRMRHKSDFPAMSDAVGRVQRLTQSESESLGSLSTAILSDVALTHKLLRLVNTAQFRHAGGGSISTVSRAAALIGFAGIRNLALSLILLEGMENKAHAQLLREEFLRSLMAGSLARELSSSARDNEESFLAAMFQNLGRLLSEYYFPEEAQQIRRITRPERRSAELPAAPVLSEAAAAVKVLGLSYEQLGIGIARQWGLPEALQRSMRRPEGDAPARLLEAGPERQRWLARAANDVADTILHSEPSEAHAKVHAMAQRYGRALGINAEVFDAAADQARQKLAQMAVAMEIPVPKASRAQRLLAPLTPMADDSLSALHMQATAVLDASRTTEQAPPHEQAVEVLVAGIQDVTNAMVESFQLNEVLRMILETIYRSMRFQRVVFCLRDAKTETLSGRFGLGEDIDALLPLFRVPLKLVPGQQADLFTAVCQKGVDTLIADALSSHIAQRLPAWHHSVPGAASFMLLPMSMKGATFAMIYADKAVAGSVELNERELSLLRTLRNQAVMAFKQSA